jgi:hypothetical protein
MVSYDGDTGVDWNTFVSGTAPGDLGISIVPDGPISPAALAAILKSGPLPEGWTRD